MTEENPENKPWQYKKGQSGNLGGRPPGVSNKLTRMQAESTMATGITPLQYLLAVMRDEKESKDRRLLAARSAAPYVHYRPNPPVGKSWDLSRLSDGDLATLMRLHAIACPDEYTQEKPKQILPGDGLN
jgi:hypothetical protein